MNMMHRMMTTEPGEPAQQVDARRQRLTNLALDDAGAAEAALLRLVAYIDGLRNQIGLGQLDDDALYATRRQLADLRQVAEALGVGVVE